MSQLIEHYLNDNQSELPLMNVYLQSHQFSEEFLIKHRCYYDSWTCLKTQKKLSPFFCFKYLYNTQDDDGPDDWTDYCEIENYLRSNHFSINEIREAYDKAMNT